MHLLDSDRLAGEDGAEVNLFVPQTDASAVGDYDDLVMEGLIDVGQAAVATRRSLIDLSRAFHAEGFVRTVVVEDLNKAVEASLLQQKVVNGRLGGFFLQGEMHAFVTAILLRMTRLDAFDADAKRSHQTASLLRWNRACAEMKGTLLSLRMLAGKPRS